MKIILIWSTLISLIFSGIATYGQTWEFIYNTHPVLGRSVEKTLDGAYIVTGSNSAGENEVTIKLDSSGNQIWNKPFGGLCIKTIRDSGYILAGWAGSPNNQDGSLRKIDKSGNTLWFKTFGKSFQDEFSSVIETSDFGYIAVGYSAFHSDSTVFIIKVDSVGDIKWQKFLLMTVGFASDIINIGNHYYITGYDNTHALPFIAKIDFDGNLSYLKYFNIDNSGISLTQSGDTTFVVVGSNGLTKFGLTGDTIWSKTFPENWSLYSIKQTMDQGFIISGTYYYNITIPVNMLVKTDSQGNLEWMKLFFTGSNAPWGLDTFESVQVTDDNGFIACGYSYYGNDYLLRVLKTDSSGNVITDVPQTILLNGIRMYPNPAKDFIKIENIPKDQHGLVSIYDMQGQSLMNRTLSSTSEILDVSSFIKGIYIIKLSLSNNIIIRKIIKE